MTSLHLSLAGMDALGRGMAQAPDMTRRELLVAATEGTLLVEREVKDGLPAVSGLTRASITSDAFATPVGVIGEVASASPVAVFLELGTKPHWIGKTGREALALWAQERLGVSAKEAPRVAFLIARKIARKGTEPKRYFAKAVEATEGQVLRRFEAAAQRIALQLGGAA